MKKCLKCDTSHQLTEHHIFPRHHFRGEGKKVILCSYCHRRLEDIILGIEAFCGDKHIGERFKLERKDYEQILYLFLPRRYTP
jgi:hypothetical protein